MTPEEYKRMADAYWRMNAEQRQQAAQQFWNDPKFQQFAKDYTREQFWDSQFSDSSQNQAQTNNSHPEQNYTQNQNYQNGQNWSNQVQYATDKQFDPNERLDESRFTDPNARVRVKEGTAQQTGRPDYEIDSDARDAEMINNLNAYKVSNPEFFRDRDTFNRAFQYHSRKSDRQRAVLDSVWKLQEDSNKVASYTSPESAIGALNNWELTKDQWALLWEKNPELMRAIQKKIEEDVALKIANRTTPADPVDTANLFNNLVEKLGLQSGVPHKIHETHRENLERYGVLRDSQRLQDMQEQIWRTYAEIWDIENRIISENSGMSEDYVQRKIQRATSSRLYKAQGLQQSYNALLTARNQNLAIANSDTEALVRQTAEDQRIFNQKLQSLGFAMQTASFETPEQQRQGQLRQLEAQNNLNLQYQDKLSEQNLKRENTRKKQEKQLESQLNDLSVTDPKQLRSNLFTALTPYFNDYGNMIMRSQSWVVDDIIAYAKQHKVSIAEAMRKNFIEPLQWKSEYKAKLNREIWYNPSQTIRSIDGKNYIESHDMFGNIKLEPLVTNQSTTNYTGSGMKWAGLRNNNPGNIKDMNFGSVIGKDARGFAQFATPEDWFDALVEKVKFNQNSPKSRYYGKTIAQYFQMYAPSSDGNNPKGYAQDVANKLWVGVNTPISQLDPIKFAAAIAKHDSWYDYSTYGQFRGANWGAKPTEAELTYYNKGATGIDPTGKKWITQQRYNEIAEYLDNNKPELSAIKQQIIWRISSSVRGLTKDQKNAFIQAVTDENGEWIKTVALNKAREIMSTDNKKEIEWYSSAIEQMKIIRRELAEYYANWGDTGLIKGKWEDVVNKFGTVADPKLRKIGVKIASALQKYRKDTTGTAFGVQEWAEIASVFPWIDKGKDLNYAIIDSRIEMMQSSIDKNYSDVLWYQLYQELKNSDIMSFYDQKYTNIQGYNFNLQWLPD